MAGSSGTGLESEACLLRHIEPWGRSGTRRFINSWLPLSRAGTLEDVFDAALTSLLDATAADGAAILLFDDDGAVRFKASQDLPSEYQTAEYQTGQMRECSRDLVFVPLAFDAGVIGRFMLYYAGQHEGGVDELEIATTIANHVAPAIEHKRAELGARSDQRLL